MAQIISKIFLIGAIASLAIAQDVESAVTTSIAGVITSSDGTVESVTAIGVPAVSSSSPSAVTPISTATAIIYPPSTGFATSTAPIYPTTDYSNVTGSATATYFPGNGTTGIGYPSGTGTGGYPPYYTGPIATGGADSTSGKGLVWGGVMAAAVGFAMGI